MTFVRSIRPDEAAALYQLRLRALAEDPDAFDQTVEDAEEKGLPPIAELVTSATTGRDLVLVAEGRDQLIGLVIREPVATAPQSASRPPLGPVWVSVDSSPVGARRSRSW